MNIIFSDGNVEEKYIMDGLKEDYGVNITKLGDVYEARDDYGVLIAMSSNLLNIIKAVIIAYDIEI